MTEITETNSIYQSPRIEILSYDAEGVLCMSNNSPNWDSNEDVL